MIYFEGSKSVAAYIATPHGCGSDWGAVAPKEYWQEIYNAAMDVAEQAGEEVSWHHIDTVWRELGRPAVGGGGSGGVHTGGAAGGFLP